MERYREDLCIAAAAVRQTFQNLSRPLALALISYEKKDGRDFSYSEGELDLMKGSSRRHFPT